jgi:hypothetical protein
MGSNAETMQREGWRLDAPGGPPEFAGLEANRILNERRGRML